MKKTIIFFTAAIVIGGVVFWYTQSNKNSAVPDAFYSDQNKAIVEADVKKVADFATVRVTLELYYEKHNKYPEVKGETSESRWQNLNKILEADYTNLGFIKPISLPQDPRHKEKGFSYDYQTDTNKQNAVLKAILEMPDDQYVKSAADSNNDVEGIIYGLDCNKPSFCVLIKHRE